MLDNKSSSQDALHSIEEFITRWDRPGAAERANYQLFLSELCDLIGVPRPNPSGADNSQNAYVFERAVVFQHGDGTSSTGRMDLYKQGCFVCVNDRKATHANLYRMKCRVSERHAAK